MSHLTRDELLRFAEGALDASRALHLGACAACREEAEALASIVAGVRSIDVPEPAPAFWDHLATRVRRAIDEEPSRPSWRWEPWPVARLALAAVAAVVAVGLVVYLARPDASGPAATPAVVTAESVDPDTAGADVQDSEWDVVMAAADAVDWETSELDALTRPGYSDLAVAEMSAEEAQALVQVLHDALAAGAERRQRS
jgi:hypothetical protein